MGGRRVAAATFHAFYVRYSTILDLDLSTIHMLFLFFWALSQKEANIDRLDSSWGLIHHGHVPYIFLFHGNQVGQIYLLVG